ncbi:unnamed protein product [Orchesella dallaii]|uniref:G-protein coupled receptors family 2 profile 2 domain-containing protein n=1 Tax=Orchesella dallaii TaxID=48710 RepID=A0ABP1S5R0_9HEXA
MKLKKIDVLRFLLIILHIHLCFSAKLLQMSIDHKVFNNTSLPPIRIPKCCDVDEIFDILSIHCVKLPIGDNPWVPTICVGDYCRSADTFGVVKTIPKQFQFCTEMTPYRGSDLKIQINQTFFHLKANAKLDISGGLLRLLYLSNQQSNQWLQHDGEYCVDGFKTISPAQHSSDLGVQIIFTCQFQINSIELSLWEWTGVAALIYSSFILFTIVVVYLLVLDKQNFQGLLIFSCCISMFFMYALNTAENYLSYYYLAYSTDFFGRNGVICQLVAIAWHFFFLSNLMWFMMISYDIWRSVNAAYLSKPSKQFKSFLKCSALAWGVPFVMVAVFTFIDKYWDEAETVIPLPGYGEESCFPKRSGTGRLYITVPLGAALAINCIFATWIVVKLLKSKKEAKWLNANSPERYT